MKPAKRPGLLLVVWLLAPLGLFLSIAAMTVVSAAFAGALGGAASAATSVSAAFAATSVSAAFAATSVSAASAATPAAFLSNLDDIPLMPGLAERKDLAISFDKPEGRIVEAIAEGRMSSDAVTKFYATTLPQLGWKGQGNNRFAREGEELALHITAASTTLTVRFTLSPKP